MADKNKTDSSEALFSKEQLISSERFSRYRDILGALLSDGKSYTVKAASDMIEKYMKGTVS